MLIFQVMISIRMFRFLFNPVKDNEEVAGKTVAAPLILMMAGGDDSKGGDDSSSSYLILNINIIFTHLNFPSQLHLVILFYCSSS